MGSSHSGLEGDNHATAVENNVIEAPDGFSEYLEMRDYERSIHLNRNHPRNTETETLAVPKKPRRYEVPLFGGNLVLTCRVPQSLIQAFVSPKRHEDPEFTTMRYSAITTSPSFAQLEHFTLRQALYPKPRRTEIVVVIPVSSSEDDEYLIDTLISLFRCIHYMCCNTGDTSWKRAAWKKIVICIVIDGRHNLCTRARQALTLLGLFQHAVMVEKVQRKNVHAHVFEYTSQVSLDHVAGSVSSGGRLGTPVQMLLCLKERYQGCQASHLWLSQAILPTLQPQSFIFVPPGLALHADAIYRLWREFDSHRGCGGVVGQLIPQASPLDWLRYPLSAVSALEQRLIHTFDKPIASGMGSAMVLPTTFSAFRYLSSQQEVDRNKSSSHYDGNAPADESSQSYMSSPDGYIVSESRSWAMAFLSQYRQRWSLAYVRRARADIPLRITSEMSSIHVPVSASDYIQQKQRHLQDKAFFYLHCISHFRQLITGRNRYIQKFRSIFMLLYLSLDLMISWFAISNLFLIFHNLNSSFLAKVLPGQSGLILEKFIRILYVFVLLVSIISVLCDDTWRSTASRYPATGRRLITLTIIWMGFACYLIFITGFLISDTLKPAIINRNDNTAPHKWWPIPMKFRFVVAIIPILCIFIIWVVATLILFDTPSHLFIGIIQYVLLIPASINFFSITVFFNDPPRLYAEQPPPLGLARLTRAGRIRVDYYPDESDLDETYQRYIDVISEGRHGTEKTSDTQAIYPRFVVLAWALSNMALCAVIWYAVPLNQQQMSPINSGRFIFYLSVINWTIGGFWVCKFVGVLWYLLSRSLHWAVLG